MKFLTITEARELADTLELGIDELFVEIEQTMQDAGDIIAKKLGCECEAAIDSEAFGGTLIGFSLPKGKKRWPKELKEYDKESD